MPTSSKSNSIKINNILDVITVLKVFGNSIHEADTELAKLINQIKNITESIKNLKESNAKLIQKSEVDKDELKKLQDKLIDIQKNLDNTHKSSEALKRVFNSTANPANIDKYTAAPAPSFDGMVGGIYKNYDKQRSKLMNIRHFKKTQRKTQKKHRKH